MDRALGKGAATRVPGAPGADATGSGPSASGPATVARLRQGFDGGITRPLEWRRAQLEAMRHLLADGEAELLEAMRADMGKPVVEARLTDLSFVGAEIGAVLRNLDRWAAAEPVPLPLVQWPGRATVVREPLGVALVIAPWNYPVHLLLLPMAAAIAAGNAVVGKPSEVTGATAAALGRLVGRHLDGRGVAVVQGGPEETQTLLAERFDSIFYTGNANVGRLVLAAAARHLTPVTLELGGKSPVLVDADADLDVAARRIAWGKFLNAGQTCVAPDYVLAHRSVHGGLVQRLRRAIGDFYGPDPRRSADYARIVSDRHFDRLTGLLETTGAVVATGGEHDRAERYIAPTLLTGVARDDPVMDDEIFGPLLPVLVVDDVDDAIGLVTSRPKPLALYVFSRAKRTVDRVIAETSSGGVGVNVTVQQLAVPGLPFGGVGASGTGAYHGRHGFETFSHRKAVLAKPTRPDPPVAYPPYGRLKQWVLKKML